MQHQYILEPYKGNNSRYTCPGCNKARTLSLYIDTKTGQHIAPHVGRCDRESNCSYHYTPKQFYQDNNIDIPKSFYKPPLEKIKAKSFSFIPVEVFKQSLVSYRNNCFTKYLSSVFDDEITNKLISQYFIGSSKKRFKSKDYPEYESERGATVFWQIDCKGRVRTGKIMLYSPSTGKRIKEPFNHISWVHSQLKEPNFNLKQCLFGEHLLKAEPAKPIAIVESEKTAIIASVYFPKSVWLAAGSLNNLNIHKCLVLSGRKVTLYPDLNGFDKWNSKAKELSDIATIHVSELLETKATQSERQQGLDLADYLLMFDYRQFINIPEPAPEVFNRIENLIKREISVIQVEKLTNVNIQENDTSSRHCKIFANWQQDIQELEQFFLQLPNITESIPLSPGSRIKDLPLFIDTHLACIKANNGNKTFLPYLVRLQKLKNILN